MRPFHKISDPITQEQADALWPRLRAGDPQAREEVIKGSMVCALAEANRYRYHRNYRDCIAEAMYALTKAVNAIINGAIDHHKNIRGYITQCIRGQLRRFNRKDRLFAIRIETWKRLEAKGQTFSGMVTLPDIEVTTKGDIPELLAVQEILSKTVFSNFERQVYELRLKDMTDPEIAMQLGCTKQHVHQTRGRIKQRIVAMIGNNNEHRRMDAKVRGTEQDAAAAGSDTGDDGQYPSQAQYCA